MDKTKKDNQSFNSLKGGVGYLHKSKDKTNENAPDYFGTVKIEGVVYSLAGWSKKGQDSDRNFISLNLDKRDLGEDETKSLRDSNLAEFKEDRKDKANKDKYIMIKGTGTMHGQPDTGAKEDFFGSFKMHDGSMRYFKGYAGVHIDKKTKKENPIVRLEMSDGLRDKSERHKLSTEFL